MLNAKKLVVTFSRAVSSLAMLAGALRLWSLELPEIAGFVMLTNISTIVFTIAFQLGDISIVIANAVSGVNGSRHGSRREPGNAGRRRRDRPCEGAAR